MAHVTPVLRDMILIGMWKESSDGSWFVARLPLTQDKITHTHTHTQKYIRA